MPNPFASTSLTAELRDGTLHLRNGEAGEDVPWSVTPDEPPSAAARTALAGAIQRLAPRRPWQPAPVVWCALPARGVVLRPVRVPSGAGAEAQRVLRMQVEAAFPVPPEELVWGAFPGDATATSGDMRTVPVAALRRALLEPLAQAIAEAGARVIFTVACAVRSPAPDGAGFGLRLDIGPASSELSQWQGNTPTRLRTLDIGAADLGAPDSVRQRLEERVLPTLRQFPVGEGSTGLSVSAGNSAMANAVADALRLLLPGTAIATLAPTAAGPGRSPATAGLEERVRSGQTSGILRLAFGEVENAEAADRRLPPSAVPWLVRAACLGLALLAFPYAEAYINRPRLKRQLDAFQKERARLGEIDRRLEFLQHIADNQPPYLDAAYVIASSAPPGAKLDGLSMNRRGEVSFSGGVQQPQQVVDFRTKLIDSKFFSSVVVEEQAQGQQGGGRVTFRMSAQWKAATDREGLQLGPELPKPPTASTNNAPKKP